MNKLAVCNSIDVVKITGYTDRIGTAEANQQLSKRRADAVADYLRANGVQASIETVGAGSTNAIKQCNEGNRTELIRCLGPNRRVSIKLQGK